MTSADDLAVEVLLLGGRSGVGKPSVGRRTAGSRRCPTFEPLRDPNTAAD
ncbi:MAG: hypothetical protein M3Y73_12355 [Actinomycetota bacterium]|nr:hypothetical protein [Actinomycetota bacterium]